MITNLATIDAETDPFKHGRIPQPFAWGLYTGALYHQFWGNNATAQFLKFLREHEDPLILYAHNGGRFDFLFFVSELEGTIRLINGRIVEAHLYHHTIRDSFAILPVPLNDSGEKTKIDYQKFERSRREKHKTEILAYLKQDCIALYHLVSAFMSEFKSGLTIGGVAMRELKKFHPYANNDSPAYDAFFRNYYYGGRCQCFETGIIKAPIKFFDVTSSYPDSMKNKKHPYCLDYKTSKAITKKTSFVRWIGTNHNAVPMRIKTGLDFTIPYGEFFTTIHEFELALEHDLIAPKKIVEAVHFSYTATMENFVEHFFNARTIARINNNLISVLFYKLILNSAYGKFAQNPEKFEDSIILPWGEVPPIPYTLAYRHNDYAIWSKPCTRKTYFNIATGASITGAARATLLVGLIDAYRPLYCDTDSVACLDMPTTPKGTDLGAWKLEAEGDSMAIAGKKLYALFNGRDVVKKASKGTILTGNQIRAIAQGAEIEMPNEAPTFKLDGRHEFVTRNIRATG